MSSKWGIMMRGGDNPRVRGHVLFEVDSYEDAIEWIDSQPPDAQDDFAVVRLSPSIVSKTADETDTEGRECPNPRCEGTMDRNSASGRDHAGRDVGVVWYVCPTCGTLIEGSGDVLLPRERAEHERQQRKKMKEALEDARARGRLD